MCLCGNPSMVLARRGIRHSGILAARNPPFGNSGGEKSAIQEFWRREILLNVQTASNYFLAFWHPILATSTKPIVNL